MEQFIAGASTAPQPGEATAGNPREAASSAVAAGLRLRSSMQTLKEARESVERKMFQDALRRRTGKVTAALELGISPPPLYELMDKLGIAKDS